MRNLIAFLILIGWNVGFCQTKKSIDSLNTIPFAIRQEKAASLIDDYLLNAKLANKMNYSLGEAESYSNLSLVYYYDGKYESDLKYSLKAIAIFEKINNLEKLALEYGELGYRMKKTNLVKAIYYMQKGKTIAEKNNFQKPLLSIYNNYGYLKELNQEEDSALFFYKKGLIIKEKIQDSVGIPYSLNNIALIYLKQKKYNEATILLNLAFKIRLKLKDEIGIAENYFYFGDLNFNQQKFSIALAFYQKCLNIALKNNFLDLSKTCFKAISESNERLGNAKESLYNYKKFSQYKDSLFSIETNSKIAALEIQFDTEKKEKLLLEKDAEAKQKNILILGISVLAFFIALIGFLIYRQQKIKTLQQVQEFKLKSAISKIENQNKLQEQRLNISRDLHDNIGAQLTFIISSVDNIKYAFDITNGKLDNKLSNISNFAKDTIVELRDTIWAMNSNEISFEDLEIRINNYIEKAKEAKDQISFSFAIDPVLKTQKLTSVQGMNIYRTIQEAVNNAIKYANASVIFINAKEVENQIKIIIQDNGIGFDEKTVEKGNGLKNMQKRIEEIGGEFHLSSSNEGTRIEILI
ncbi:MAG: tetratricopeptide repeat protein [Flavobacterium sp.]|uniref:tetratricopeptide repeat-containing sensor histidine kinase n=1 Tax=Flavobacterium sp. TaxID=239 RepID=UPI00261DAC68|nr:tetratricopeptide repeat protein [Flavobacterium sp.]MDD5150654.1 tetratricopeptide repeat protein [Flavobacterium sp.]